MLNLRVLILWLLCHGAPPCFGREEFHLDLEPKMIQGRCPGDVVTLTCTMLNLYSQIYSYRLAWRSDEYIGPSGAELVLSRRLSVGDRENSRLYPSSVFATLDGESLDHLTSTLNITLSAEFQRSSVSCVNLITGDMLNATISLLDEAQALSGVKSVLRRKANNTCAVDLLWDLPTNFAEGDVSHFMVTVNDGDNMTMNETAANHMMCVCKPHNVTITLVDRCGRNASTTSVVTLNTTEPLFECDLATATAPSTLVNDPLTLGLFVAVLVLFVIAVVSILLIIILGYKILKNNKSPHCTRKEERRKGVLPSQSGDKDGGTEKDNPSCPSGEKDNGTEKGNPTSTSENLGGATKKDDLIPPPGNLDDLKKRFEKEDTKNKSSDLPKNKRGPTWVDDD